MTTDASPTPDETAAELLDEAHKLEAKAAELEAATTPAPTAPTPAPAAPRKTIAEWRAKKPSWLFDSAAILAGWTQAQRHQVEPLTLTEAEYDAAIEAAGNNPHGSKPAAPKKVTGAAR